MESNGFDVMLWISSFWLLATIGIPFIIEFIYENIAKPKTSLWKSIWSWVIPITGFYIAWAAGQIGDIGFLAAYEVWWAPAIMGALAAGIANYGWDNIGWVKTVIKEIIKRIPKTYSDEKEEDSE